MEVAPLFTTPYQDVSMTSDNTADHDKERKIQASTKGSSHLYLETVVTSSFQTYRSFLLTSNNKLFNPVCPKNATEIRIGEKTPLIQHTEMCLFGSPTLTIGVSSGLACLLSVKAVKRCTLWSDSAEISLASGMHTISGGGGGRGVSLSECLLFKRVVSAILSRQGE